MPDAASINRSLSTIRTELEFLQASNVLSGPQFQSIMAQLPVRLLPPSFPFPYLHSPLPTQTNLLLKQNGQPSNYIDPRYNPNPQQQFNPGVMAQQAQDPAHPANPQNPGHHEWIKSMAMKFGNAAMFGAGATFGGDMVNDALGKF
jgi:hypothetical protein